MTDGPPKLFPRNLTARADYLVRGNPANSRPESGVDNCYPGLEFDSRTLDQFFFPGLRFEFHLGSGAVVAGPAPGGNSPLPFDPAAGPPLFLWFLYARVGSGTPGSTPPEPTLFDGTRKWGSDAWRHVHDLLPGRVALLLGPAGSAAIPLGADQALPLLRDAWARPGPYGNVERLPDGGIGHVVLADARARYLDPDGVVDPHSIGPGELTKSLCAPWIYDFRDCYCFYWASNKPDLAAGPAPDDPPTAFLRRDRTVPPPPDVATWTDRASRELGFVELLEGAWRTLPTVISDRESNGTARPAGSDADPERPLLTRSEVVAELSYLATVEHALTVEYLFALYSLRAPRRAADAVAPDAALALDPATQLFEIAVDEMRHFLWVNHVLFLLDADPSTGRAERLGTPPAPDSPRPQPRTGRAFLDLPFRLAPLRPDVLQGFIDVEAPSRAINEGLDGMYTELLRSIRDQPVLFTEQAQIVPTLKLIIDEGAGHYHRFCRIRDGLAGMPPASYLRPLAAEPDAVQRRYLALADTYYQTILDAIAVSFGLGPAAGGMLVQNAVRSMQNLDDVCRTLAEMDVAPRFALRPLPPAASQTPAAAAGLFKAHADAHGMAVAALEEAGHGAQAERHARAGALLFGRLQATIAEAAATS